MGGTTTSCTVTGGEIFHSEEDLLYFMEATLAADFQFK